MPQWERDRERRCTLVATRVTGPEAAATEREVEMPPSKRHSSARRQEKSMAAKSKSNQSFTSTQSHHPPAQKKSSFTSSMRDYCLGQPSTSRHRPAELDRPTRWEQAMMEIDSSKDRCQRRGDASRKRKATTHSPAIQHSQPWPAPRSEEILGQLETLVHQLEDRFMAYARTQHRDLDNIKDVIKKHKRN